jgi:hypothetical protein
MEKGCGIIFPQLILPTSEGSVSLGKGKEAHSQPRIKHCYLQADIDVRKFVSICKQSIKIKDEVEREIECVCVLVCVCVCSSASASIASGSRMT